MLNVNMLKGRMVEKGITVSELSKELNINQATFYRKMKNNSFKIFETDIIMNTLQLSPSEANKFFFAKKTHKMRRRQNRIKKGSENVERTATTIRLPAELKEKLQQEADRLGISFNGLVIDYLWKSLKSK